MNKQEFFKELAKKLNNFLKSEIDKSISYYEEMLYDHIEDGMTKEEAIKSFSDIDNIVKNIVSDISVPNIIKSNINANKKNSGL